LKVLFAGTPEFAARHLIGLLSSHINIVGIITQPDKPGKRGKKPIPSAVKLIAVDHDIPLIQPRRLVRDDISAFQADLLVVVAYGQILKSDVLKTPGLGCINVHGSLLPRWRGAAPIQRAILAGDHETGVCIMQMDEGLDTGDVLSSRSMPITPEDTTLSLSSRLATLGTDALVETIHALANGTAIALSQPEQGACYAHKITKREANCDWQLSCEEIDRKIRAFTPEPICYTFLGDLRVKLLQACCDNHETGSPGEITAVTRQGVTVACGTGSLLIQRLQLPLGKGSSLSGADILNARSDLMHAGVVFKSSPT